MNKQELAKQYADKKVAKKGQYIDYDFDVRKELTNFDGYDIEQAYEDGFDAGRTNAVESIWHKKTECPTKKTRCILIATHGGFMANDRIDLMEDWQRWAYIEDLLPNIPDPLEVVREILKVNENEDTKDK